MDKLKINEERCVNSNANFAAETNNLDDEDYNKPAEHTIILPTDWWVSNHSYDGLSTNITPILRLLKRGHNIKGATLDLKGWDIRQGDYSVNIDESDRDFEKDKTKQIYWFWAISIIFTISVVYFSILSVAQMEITK